MRDDIYTLLNENKDNFFESGDKFSEPYFINRTVFSEDFPNIFPLYIPEIEKKTKSTNVKVIQKKDEGDEPELYTSNDILEIFNKESNKNKISEIFKKLKFRNYI